MAEAYEGLLDSIEEAAVTELCRDLVRFKSVNPPGDELEVAQYVADVLGEAGLSVEIVPHTSTRASVLATLKGSGEVPAVLFTGHLDVVPVGAQAWEHDPFAADIADGKLWGRGASDMKSGDAAMIAATQVLAASDMPLKGDLILAFTAGEEGEQLGANELVTRLESLPMQAVIVAEPSSNDVYLAEKGVCWLKLTTHGQTSHGSMPDLGRNAILMMMTLLDEFQSLTVPYDVHPLLGHFTRSVDTIKGGVGTNVVPDHCEVTVDQRTVPGQDHNAIVGQVEDLIAELEGRIEGFRASVEVINNLVPVATSPDDPVVKQFYDAVESVRGQRPEPKGVNYYTDAAVFAPQLGLPMIICGPGEAGLAHQPNEYVEISKMVDSARIFTLAAAQMLT